METCVMQNHVDVWPSNIDTAEMLIINNPCQACDVYQLISDRPNIKKVKVCGVEMSHQEIRNMDLNELLDGGGHPTTPIQRAQIWERLEAITDPIMQAPTPPPIAPNPIEMPELEWYVPEQIYPVPPIPPARPPGPAGGIYNQVYETVRTTMRTDNGYRQYMERLMAENPQWREFGDPAPRPTLAQVNAEDALRNQLGNTIDYVWSEESIGIADDYTSVLD